MHFCQLHIFKYTSIINEHALQYDAYRPLVDVSRGVCIQGAHLRGLPGGSLHPGGSAFGGSASGVSASRGPT